MKDRARLLLVSSALMSLAFAGHFAFTSPLARAQAGLRAAAVPAYLLGRLKISPQMES